MPIPELTSPTFQQDVLNMLQPKINVVLHQTTLQERLDLKQELSLMIIQTIQTKEFKKIPSFFELLEIEKITEENFKYILCD